MMRFEGKIDSDEEDEDSNVDVGYGPFCPSSSDDGHGFYQEEDELGIDSDKLGSLVIFIKV